MNRGSRSWHLTRYDDVQQAWPSYQLSTVHQPADEMVDRSIEILLSQINGNAKRQKRLLSIPLLKRVCKNTGDER